jgi:hypothetical protein
MFLDCDRAYPRGFEIPAQSYHKINKGTENEYEASGLSESGQKKISNFCKDLDFYYGRTFQNPAK